MRSLGEFLFVEMCRRSSLTVKLILILRRRSLRSTTLLLMWSRVRVIMTAVGMSLIVMVQVRFLTECLLMMRRSVIWSWGTRTLCCRLRLRALSCSLRRCLRLSLGFGMHGKLFWRCLLLWLLLCLLLILGYEHFREMNRQKDRTSWTIVRSKNLYLLNLNTSLIMNISSSQQAVAGLHTIVPRYECVVFTCLFDTMRAEQFRLLGLSSLQLS